MASMDHSEMILQTLNEFRTTDYLCDIDLVVDGQVFAAHRNVLAASSPFFKGLFSSNMKEKQHSSVMLEQLHPTIMDGLLEYLYIGVTNINDSNAVDFILASDFLLLQDLKDKAEDVLDVSFITIEDCIDQYLFADRHQCPKLKNRAFEFILKHFADVYKMKDFQNLDYETLLELVRGIDVVVHREEDIYEAILKWLDYDNARQKLFPELFSHLRIFSMSADYIEAFLLSDTSLVHCYSSCKEHIQKSLKNYDPCSPVGLRPRKCLDQHFDAIVICNRAFDPKVNCLVPDQGINSWYELQPVSKGLSWQSLVYCQGHIYAISGIGWEGCHNPVSYVHCYDPYLNIWTQKASLPQDTDDFGAAGMDHYVYVIGGHDRHGAKLDSVQRYDVSSNSWESKSTNFTPARSGSSVVSHNGHLYVIGGCTERKSLNTLAMYTPTSDTWCEVTPMKFTRSYACATVVNDHIFVVSGHSEEKYGENSFNDVKPITACEVYDTVSDTWSQIADINLQRSDAGIAYFNEKVYVFGGDDIISFAELEETFEYFDLKTKEWSDAVEFVKIQLSLARPRACSVRLPSKLSQGLQPIS